ASGLADQGQRGLGVEVEVHPAQCAHPGVLAGAVGDLEVLDREDRGVVVRGRRRGHQRSLSRGFRISSRVRVSRISPSCSRTIIVTGATMYGIASGLNIAPLVQASLIMIPQFTPLCGA